MNKKRWILQQLSRCLTTWVKRKKQKQVSHFSVESTIRIKVLLINEKGYIDLIPLLEPKLKEGSPLRERVEK